MSRTPIAVLEVQLLGTQGVGSGDRCLGKRKVLTDRCEPDSHIPGVWIRKRPG